MIVQQKNSSRMLPSNVIPFNYYNNNYGHCYNDNYYGHCYNDNNCGLLYYSNTYDDSYYNRNYDSSDYNNNEKVKYEMGNTIFEVDTKYIPIKALGKGAYGVVCASINTDTKERVAIKKIANVFANKVQALRILREMKILRYVHHDNIITLKDIMITSPKSSFEEIYLVFELMDNDLRKIISSNHPLPKDRRQYFMLQILKGVNYLHTANILHRDLKPENILVNGYDDLKICDLGLARTTKGKGYAGTLRYQAPEILVGGFFESYDKSVDIWSVGCIFAELLGRKPLFRGTNRSDQLDKIFDVLETQPDCKLDSTDSENAIKEMSKVNFSHLFPDADPLEIDLLDRMLRIKANERITAADALRHPYLANLYDPKLNDLPPFTIHLDALDDATEEEIRNLMVVEMNLLHLLLS